MSKLIILSITASMQQLKSLPLFMERLNWVKQILALLELESKWPKLESIL